MTRSVSPTPQIPSNRLGIRDCPRPLLPAAVLLTATALLAPACAPTAPEAPDEPLVLHNHADPNSLIQGIQRSERKGRLLQGSVEAFRALLSEDAPANAELSWTADEGKLVADGDSVRWAVPTTGAAILTLRVLDPDSGRILDSADFPFKTHAYNPAAQGVIDPTPDETGSNCDLAIDAADIPHVIYRNDTHASLHYAVWNGSSWDTELIDGPGFGIGSTISADIALTLDAAGTPHVAYRYQNSPYEIRYAVKSGPGWTLEQVNPTVPSRFNSPVAIALDPAAGNRPVIAFTRDSWDDPVVTYRSAPGSWVETPFGQAGSHFDFTGGLAVDSAGTAHLSFGEYWVYYTSFTPAGGFTTEELLANNTDNFWSPLILDGAEEPIILHEEGIEHVAAGNWVQSEIEAFDIPQYDIAYRNGPAVALRHDGNLELITPNPQSYWLYSVVDTVENYGIGAAIDSDGDPHACYRDNGQVRFY